jgi:hypothetical protein
VGSRYLCLFDPGSIGAWILVGVLAPLCGCGAQLDKSMNTTTNSSSPNSVPAPPSIPPVTNPPARSGPFYTVGTDVPSLQACVNIAVPESTCMLPSGFLEHVAGPINISASHISIECAQGASVIAEASDRIFIITGTDITIAGCDLDGGLQNGFSSYGIAIRDAHSVNIFNNTFHDFANVAIRITRGSSIDIEGNRFSELRDNAVYGEMSIDTITVANNPLIDVSQRNDWGAGVALHSTAPGETVKNITISNNFISNGSSFCVEIGAFGGNPPSNVLVLNNYCRQGSDTGDHGGYSFENTTGIIVRGNLYDLHGTRKATLPGIELVLGTRAAVTDNSLYGLGLSLDRQSASEVSNNVIHDPLGGIAVYLGANVASSAVSGNVVTENHIYYSLDQPSETGIWLQCNGGNADCSGNQIEGNFLNSSEISGVGINIQRDQGVMQNNSITGNTISQFQTCIKHGSYHCPLD